MSEEVVARVNEVRLYFGEKPPAVGLPKGGQLVLTNRRIVFIKGLYGPVDLDWGLKIEGSFMIPLSDIIEAKAERSFLRLRYRTSSGEEKACSLLFISKLSGAISMGLVAGLPGAIMGGVFGAPSLSKTPYEQMANAIESVKKAHESSAQK